MICPNCNTQNDPGARFCSECGKPLPAEHMPSYTQPSFNGGSPPPSQMPSGAVQPPHPQMTYTDTPGKPYGPYVGTGQQIPSGTAYGGGQIPPGTAYGGGQMPYGSMPQEPVKKKGSGLAIALVAAVCVLIVAIAVFALVLSGAIGGRRDPGGSAADASTQADTTDTTEPTADTTEDTTEATAEVTKPETGGGVTQLDVTVRRQVLKITLDTGSGERVVDTISYDRLELAEDAPAALRKSISDFNVYIEEYCNSYLLQSGPELYEWFSGAMGETAAYSHTVELAVHRADDAVFSVVMKEESYMGGAHPYLEYTGSSFDARTGESLSLSDVVADREALAGAVYTEMMKDPAMKQLEDLLQGAGTGSLLEFTRSYLSDETLSFALTNEGIVLLYSDYMLGSYAAGSAEIFVPYAGNEAAFVATYMESADPEDDVTAHVYNAPGGEESRDLVSLCEEAGIDVTQGIMQGITQGTCTGTYYCYGDHSLAHVTFEEDGTYTAYYAHGGTESAGTYAWSDRAVYDFEWTGVLTDTSGNRFAEVHYYPLTDMVEINGTFYLK